MDLSNLRDTAHISVQTIAVIFLGWLSTEMGQLNDQLKQLNDQMVEIVVVTRQHDKDIVGLKIFADQLNREFVSRQDFEENKKAEQALRSRIWDELYKRGK